MTIPADTPVRVRAGGGSERDAVIVEDRGSRYRVRYADGSTGTVLHERVRVPSTPKTVILPPRPEALPDLPRVSGQRAELRAVPKPPKPLRDAAYLARVRGRMCCMLSGRCAGPIVAHHHGPRGMGEKTDDYRTVPLCDVHHREFHATGTVSGYRRADIDALFATEMVAMLAMHMGGIEDAVDALIEALRRQHDQG